MTSKIDYSLIGVPIGYVVMEDGPWWFLCPDCGWKVARLTPDFNAACEVEKNEPGSTDKEKRVAPKLSISFKCQFMCDRCGKPTARRRVEVQGTIEL